MTITDLSGFAQYATDTDIDPDTVFDDMLTIIQRNIAEHPRSAQQEIGPSELGHPCNRWFAYKLANAPKINTAVSWRTAVGVAVHNYLSDLFHADCDNYDQPRWWTENLVHVGRIEGPDGYEVYGSCDTYELFSALVTDWKIVAKTTLQDARRNGPGHKYRVQGHAYGRGWTRRGLPVRNVSVAFLPASGELDEAVFWHEPYNEQIVIDALAKVNAVNQLVAQVGVAAATILPTAEHYCTRCPYFRPNSTDFTAACPGDPGIRRSGPDPINTLIA